MADDGLIVCDRYIGKDHAGSRALSMLDALRFAASAGQCSIDTVRWLEEALAEFIQGRADDFGTALGFRPAERQELRMAMRNQYLMLALAEVSGPESDTGRCKQLAEEIARFETRVWPRACAYTSPDPAWSNLRCFIFRAHQYDDKLPSHWQSIDRIQKLHRHRVALQLHSLLP